MYQFCWIHVTTRAENIDRRIDWNVRSRLFSRSQKVSNLEYRFFWDAIASFVIFFCVFRQKSCFYRSKTNIYGILRAPDSLPPPDLGTICQISLKRSSKNPLRKGCQEKNPYKKVISGARNIDRYTKKNKIQSILIEPKKTVSLRGGHNSKKSM